jgi:hypothetical protein
MPRKWFGRIALTALLVFLCQATTVLAGTTGALSGIIALTDGTPIASANVTVTSPSESITTKTDANGHFTFVSLIPDTYTVTVSKDGYQTVSQAGVTVTADNTQSVNITTTNAKVIGIVPVRGNADLVKPGTTSDVYSVNGKTAKAAAAFGGGGGLDNAYSSVASLPGAYVPQGQSGWFQAVYIRGGDFDQVGYEFDGVPVNRSFDNYPTTNASSLGQQELQVYTGASPANAESQGLAGFINQVIRAGTYPGYADVSMGFGAPTMYNKFNLEVGGATPDRNFSYYVGLGGYDQKYRYYDQNNGASVSDQFGTPFDFATAPSVCTNAQLGDQSNCAINYANTAFLNTFPAGPGGYVLGPFQAGLNSNIRDRENVVNLHFGIPHHNDAGKDDIQLLYDESALYTYTYTSFNDWGGTNFWGGGTNPNSVDCQLGGLQCSTYPVFFSGFQYQGALGKPITASSYANIIPYLYPSEGAHGANGAVPASQEDGSQNDQGIAKIQYQHNIGSSAYLRLYAYSYYSDWFNHSPNSVTQDFIGGPFDYELWTHTHGYSVSYADQLNAKNLLNVEGSYVTAQSVRDNNTQMLDAGGSRSRFGVLVDSTNPMSGICYNNAGGPAVAAECEPTSTLNSFRASFLTYTSGFADVSAQTCGSGPCEWLAVENGPNATFNTVTPKFDSFSIQDQFKPSDKWLFNAGLRYDRFGFDLAPTVGQSASVRQFWFNAWNKTMCVNSNINGGNPVNETSGAFFPAMTVGTPCSNAGAGWANATMSNGTANGNSVSFPELQPRLGGTYTADVNNVFRFSYGKYVQPPNAAFEQYNVLQENLPNFIGPLWYKLGYTTPEHDVRPSVSYNSDLSWEHHFANTDASFKLTPFYRRTQDQIQQFFIDPKTAFVSGVNAGKQTSSGVEFLLNKGDFSHNGLSGQVSYTYTYSRIKYSPLPNGSTLLTPINTDIQLYNSFTKACQGVAPSNSPTSLCGANSGHAVPTESNGVANPYFNMAAQQLFDPNASYVPFTIVPAGLNLSATSYEVPSFAALILNYRHDKFSVTPSFQFTSGGRYGAPEMLPGVNPETCGAIESITGITNDPRYPKGGTGNPYDAPSCTGNLVIPDNVTGRYDAPGAFVSPSRLTMHMQFAYDVNPRTTMRFTLANLVDRCYGGTSEPWVTGGSHFCSYGIGFASIPAAGNFYNPGDTLQRFVKFPYDPASTTQPFNAYFTVDIKL